MDANQSVDIFWLMLPQHEFYLGRDVVMNEWQRSRTLPVGTSSKF
jgi:hypothetical protein